MKKYELTIWGIAQWYGDALNDFKEFGDVDDLLQKNNLGEAKRQVIEINWKEGWVIFESELLQKKKKSYAKLKGHHESLCTILQMVQKYESKSVVNTKLAEYDEIEAVIQEKWAALSPEVQNQFIDQVKPYLKDLTPQQTETKNKKEPKVYEELFFNPEHAEPCLKILSELWPPVIDAKNNYIGNAKGVFPLWVKVLKNHKPDPLIKHFKDTVYKDLLNQKIKGLNLTEDASEFRKVYKRVENSNIELDIKTILSQYSQSGKLGK